MNLKLLAFLSLAFLFACQGEEKQPQQPSKPKVEEKKPPKKPEKFPEVKTVSADLKSELLPTLDASFSPEHNGIYGAILGLAWDRLQDTLGPPVKVSESPQLEHLNRDTYHQNALRKGEYTSKVEWEDGRIRVRTVFKRSLPYKESMALLYAPLEFNGQPVQAFGFDKHTSGAPVDLHFYEDDDHFALQLRTKSRQHEIYLLKLPLPDSPNLLQAYHEMEKRRGEYLEARGPQNTWRYEFMEDDELRVPKLAFHLEQSYPEMEQARIKGQETEVFMESAFMRIGFSLDEAGAKIDMEALMDAVEEIMEEEDKPRPKELVFDEPFVVMLKRRDADYPYFAMYVANTMWMFHPTGYDEPAPLPFAYLP